MRNFTPILSVLALAGSTDAAKHAAFADVTRGLVAMLAHGTRNILQDTRDALAELKGAQAKRCAAFIETVYAAGNVEFDAHKRRPVETVAPIADAIVAKAIAAFDADEESAKAAKAAKAAAAALKAAAKAVEPAARVLTLADALEMVRAACVAGDETARDAVIGIVETFADVAIA